MCEYLSSCTAATSSTCSCQSTCAQGERLATDTHACSALGTYVLPVHLLQVGLGRQNKGVAIAVNRNSTQWELLLMQGVSRFLDRTGNEDRAAIKLHAKAAEYVYEDEYDDSYDDLGGGGADGKADVEGAVLSIPPAAPVSADVLYGNVRSHRDSACFKIGRTLSGISWGQSSWVSDNKVQEEGSPFQQLDVSCTRLSATDPTGD